MSAIDLQTSSQSTVRAALAARWRWAALLALLALLALGLKGWLIYGRARAVRADIAQIQSVAQAPLDRAAGRLGPLLGQTRADIAALRAESWPLLPITPYLGWLPVYGGDIAAAGPLLDAGVELSAAADAAFVAFGPLLAPADAAPITGAQLRERIAAAGPQIDTARAALDRAATSWAQLDLASLSPALAAPLGRVGQALPLARLGLALAPALPDALDDLQQLAPYTRGQPSKAQLAALGPLLAKARKDVAALHAAATPLTQPPAGQPAPAADLAAIAPLLDTVAGLTVAADEAYAGLAPLLLDRAPGTPIGAAVVDQLGAAQSRLLVARDAAAHAADAWDRAQIDRLPAGLAARLRPIGGLAAALRDGMELTLALPELLGARAPAEYLLLAQNPDELRATGGFVGAAGTFTLRAGRPGEIVLRYSPDIDDIANVVYPDPPQPQLRYMNIEMWLFRDANWSPDFPSAAKQARALYALGQGHAPANVVAFDPYAAQYLLGAIGPVTVEGSAAPIDAKNVFAYLRSEHDAQQGQENPKAYIGRLANAMIARVERAGAGLDIWALAQAFRRALAERHLLIDTPLPAAAALFARHGWDGAVRPGPNDFLALVDTNMGYNKVNANIRQLITYTVNLSEPSAPQAELTVRYTNTVASPAACSQFVDDHNSYEDWMRRCFYDYMRVLVPRGSRLAGATTRPVPDAWMESGAGDDGTVHVGVGAGDTAELSVFQVIGFGETRDTVLRYGLPATVLTRDAAGWHYRLRLRKQPGTDALPFAVELTLPAGTAIVAATPAPAQRSGQNVRFAGTLATDQAIELVFR